MRYREPAICLRSTDYSETSQVLHFLTPGEGLVHVIGKGTKRPKSKSGGAIDLLSEGQLVFSARNTDVLGTLIEFTETESRPGLRTGADRLYAALYAAEMACEMLGVGDPHPGVFDLLHNAFSRLAQADAPPQAVLAFYQWRFLRHTGLMGDLTRCAACGESLAETAGGAAGLSFSSNVGGLLCSACEGGVAEKLRVAAGVPEAVLALRAAVAGKRAVLAEPQARALNRMLCYHAQHQVGKRLKTARYAIG